MPPSKNISFDELAKYFHLPINQVAKELGVCATILKKICRRNGIPRWPHRKIKSLDKMIANLEVNLAKNPAEREEITHEVELLKSKKAEIMRNPDILVSKKSHLNAHGKHGLSSSMKKTKQKSTNPGDQSGADLTNDDEDYSSQSSEDLVQPNSYYKSHDQSNWNSESALLAARRPSLPIITPPNTNPTINLPPPVRRHSFDVSHLELSRTSPLIGSPLLPKPPVLDFSQKLAAFNFSKDNGTRDQLPCIEPSRMHTPSSPTPTQEQKSLLPAWFIEEKNRVLGPNTTTTQTMESPHLQNITSTS